LVHSELEGLVDARQKLESQQQENQGVQSEFAQLDDDSNIYKLIGPVLLKQDKTEAVMAVSGRLEFIEKEMWVSRSAFAGLSFTDPPL
jgi:prefoldin beta subunit